MTEPPRAVGAPRELNLTGKLFPWADGQPVFLVIQGTDRLALPCFSSADGLRAALEGIAFESIKQIEDGPEFLLSVPNEIDVILDLRKVEGGKIRYALVKRN